jgi:hypothetical protein
MPTHPPRRALQWFWIVAFAPVPIALLHSLRGKSLAEVMDCRDITNPH